MKKETYMHTTMVVRDIKRDEELLTFYEQLSVAEQILLKGIYIKKMALRQKTSILKWLCENIPFDESTS